MAKPTKYEEDMQGRAEKQARSGNNMNLIAADLGVCPRTLDRWAQ
jgi:hypothetical protein